MPVTVGDEPHSYHWMPCRVGQLAKKFEVMIGFAVLQVFLIVLFFFKKEGRK
jgi:hypothetical protein